jgi:hypothetical protein
LRNFRFAEAYGESKGTFFWGAAVCSTFAFTGRLVGFFPMPAGDSPNEAHKPGVLTLHFRFVTFKSPFLRPGWDWEHNIRRLRTELENVAEQFTL